MIKVRDLMQRYVITVSAGSTLPELERALLNKNVSGFPVMNAGRLVGVVSRSDVVRQICVERTKAEYTSDFYCDYAGFSIPRDAEQSFTEIAETVGCQIDHLSVADVMNHDVFSIAPDESLSAAARLMVNHHIHRLPVVEDQALVGVISSLDIVRYVADQDV